jgi:hypothetical protein
MAINPSYIPFIYCVVIFAALVPIFLLCERMCRTIFHLGWLTDVRQHEGGTQGGGIDANPDVRQHEGGSQGGGIPVGVTTHV